MRPEVRRAAIKNFLGMQSALTRIEKLALELMRHPTASDEDVLAAREMYRRIAPRVHAAREQLIKLGVIHER